MVSLLRCAIVTYSGVKPCGSSFRDLMITIYMTPSLIQGRGESPFWSTWSLSVKLIKLTIETGWVITIAAVLEFILAIVHTIAL
ncbi:hypothetical protein BDN67DRAFT_970604 [Paxillus ammoniavirescens]|nr:hypothetical protein BDN67DRAFT_970604 [Paxillus ammoniavirescens]